MSKSLVTILLAAAALSFVVGTVARFVAAGSLAGLDAVVFWRGAIGFLGFAIALTLIQIRDGNRS